jgi:hypothetical protein
MTPEQINRAADSVRAALAGAGFLDAEVTDPAEADTPNAVICAMFSIDGKWHSLAIKASEL